jgi:putative colanic acid biosynthesis UDP-glucose lipid carrier transferase
MVDATLQASPQQTRRVPRLTSADPSAVFAVKSLYYPVVSVACLLGCVLLWREPIYGPNFLFTVLTFVVVSNSLGIARIERLVDDPFGLRSLSGVLVRWCLVVGFIWALLHLSRLTPLFRKDMYVAWAVCTPAILWLGQLAMQRTIAGHQARPRKAVIVGLTALGMRLEQHLQNSLLGTEVVGYIEDRNEDRLPPASAARVVASPAGMSDFIARKGINVVYVTLPMTRHPRILDLLESLRDSTVSIYFVPDLFTFDLIQARFDVIGGVPVVAVRESPFYGARAIAKRLSDILIAGSALLAAAPVLLAVAIGVRWSSPGPTLFKQKRYGLDGREILVYKFRSMSVSETSTTVHKAAGRNDARVTPFGAFIRRTSLDELPQLFNVLEGSMSIVGPRPHPVAMNEQYRRLIPGYMIRHKVKPGITGWAQVNGYRGGDDLESMKKRIEYDLDYLRRWSLSFDLAIILATALVVLRDKNAY